MQQQEEQQPNSMQQAATTMQMAGDAAQEQPLVQQLEQQPQQPQDAQLVQAPFVNATHLADRVLQTQVPEQQHQPSAVESYELLEAPTIENLEPIHMAGDSEQTQPQAQAQDEEQQSEPQLQAQAQQNVPPPRKFAPVKMTVHRTAKPAFGTAADAERSAHVFAQPVSPQPTKEEVQKRQAEKRKREQEERDEWCAKRRAEKEKQQLSQGGTNNNFSALTKKELPAVLKKIYAASLTGDTSDDDFLEPLAAVFDQEMRSKWKPVWDAERRAHELRLLGFRYIEQYVQKYWLPLERETWNQEAAMLDLLGASKVLAEQDDETKQLALIRYHEAPPVEAAEAKRRCRL